MTALTLTLFCSIYRQYLLLSYRFVTMAGPIYEDERWYKEKVRDNYNLLIVFVPYSKKRGKNHSI